MADTKISALASASQLTGAEYFSAVQGGANVKVPGSALRPIGMGYRPRIGFAGDSIGSVWASGGPQSPFQASLWKKPRRLGVISNFTHSGTYSGPLGTYAGIDLPSTNPAPDFNMPNNLAAMIAAKLDILFVPGLGGNDPGQLSGQGLGNNLTLTYGNIKAGCLTIIAALPNIRIVLSAPPPQYGRTAPFATQMRAQLMALQTAYPRNIFVLDDTLSSGDDQTNHANIGGNTNSANSTADNLGQHPSAVLARALEPRVTELLDLFGVPTEQPYFTHQGDRGDINGLSYGNWIGLQGSQSGSQSFTSGSLSGTTPNDGGLAAQQGLSDSYLTGTSTAGDALSYQGNTFRATKFSVNTSASDTAGQINLYFNPQPLSGSNAGGRVRGSMLFEVISGGAICGVTFAALYQSGGSNVALGTGGFFSDTYGAQGDMAAGVYPFILPDSDLLMDNNSRPQLSVNVYFRSAVAANPQFRVAQIVGFCEPAAP